MTLQFESLDGGILLVTIARAAKGNSLDTQVITALGDLAERLAAEGVGTTRTVIITGEGDRAFSAGADITTLRGLSASEAEQQMRRGQIVFDKIEGLPQLTIAAINGAALGGGLELAMACDLRVAVPHARLGLPEITLANLPGWGGTQRLPILIGKGRALEMILTGQPVLGDVALTTGLITSVASNAVEGAIELASRIGSNAASAVAAAKDAVLYGERHGITEGLVHEAVLVGERCETPEQRAAVDAFLNRKITPNPSKAEPS